MNKKIICCLIAAAVVLFQQICFGENTEPYKIYVSEKGSVISYGTQSETYTDIEQAKKRVRELIESSKAPNGIEVIFREGTYHIEKTISFTAEDSGTAETPITYKSYPGEKVVFTAGQSIDASKFSLVTDEKTLNRLPEDARGYVYSLNLPAQGIYDYGVIRLLTMQTNSEPSPAMLIVNDDIADLSGWPNNGSFTHVKEMFPYSGWGYDFSMEEDRISRWTAAEEPYVYGQFMNDWADDMAGILRMDPNTRRIVTSRGFVYGCKVGGEFRVINLLEEIDVPGEYYINRNDGTLYYYPKEDTDITKSKMELLTFSDNLFEFDNASYINFEGIIITGTCHNAFSLKNDSSNNSFRNMEFTNLGGCGIDIVDSSENVIDHSWFHDMGKGCIRISGAKKQRENVEKCNNIISNNLMESFTEVGKKYVEAIRLFGNGDTVTHNRIHDSGHAAINFGGCMNVIEYNDIYAVTKESKDAGSIYSGGFCTMNGNTVRYNYIHDGPYDGYWGRQGVYFDDLLTGNEIYGNYMVNINAGISFHAAKYCTAVNNFFFNIQGQAGISSGGVHMSGNLDDCLKASAMYKEKWENEDFLKNDYSGVPAYYIPKVKDIIDVYNYPASDKWYEKWPFTHPDVLFGKGFFKGAQGNVLKGNILISPKNLYLAPLHDAGEYPYKKDTGIDSVSIDCVMENNHEIVDNVSNYVEDAANGNYNIKDEKILSLLDKELIPDFKLPRLEEIGIEDEPDKLEMEDFNILYPKNGQKDVDANDVVLCWEGTPTAVKYHLVVAKDKNFNNVILDTTTFMNYYRFRNLEFGETTYFWKVEGLSEHWKYAERKRMNKNGIHTFRTLMSERVNKTLLGEKLNYANEQYNSASEGAEPGQSVSGAKETFKQYIDEAQKVMDKRMATNKEVNNILQNLNRAAELFESSKNPEIFDITDLFADASNWTTNIENNTAIFESSGGYSGNLLKRHHILAFSMEPTKLSDGGYISIGIRSNSISQAPWNCEEYIFLVKKDTIELQKFNGNNRFFYDTANDCIKDGKKSKILFSALTEKDGVRVVLNVDGKEIFNVLDTNNTVATGGMLHVYSQAGVGAKLSGYDE